MSCFSALPVGMLEGFLDCWSLGEDSFKDCTERQLSPNALQMHFADGATLTLVVVETVVTVNLVTENFPLDTQTKWASETLFLPRTHSCQA